MSYEATGWDERDLAPSGEYAVVMVKPHAVDTERRVEFVGRILAHDERLIAVDPTAQRVHFDILEAGADIPVEVVAKTELRLTPAHIDQIYGADADANHYPALQQIYQGPAMFYVIRSMAGHDEMQRYLRTLKGKNSFHDGETMQEGFGLRGRLLPAQYFISQHELDTAPTDDRLIMYRLFLNNVIHTTDSPRHALDILSFLVPDDVARRYAEAPEDIQIRAFAAYLARV